MLSSSRYKSRGVLGRLARRRSCRGRVVLIAALDLNDPPFPTASYTLTSLSQSMMFGQDSPAFADDKPNLNRPNAQMLSS